VLSGRLRLTRLTDTASFGEVSWLAAAPQSRAAAMSRNFTTVRGHDEVARINPWKLYDKILGMKVACHFAVTGALVGSGRRDRH
jgi:hypothetical protein